LEVLYLEKIEGTTGVIRRTYNTINGQNKRGDDVPLAPSYVKSFVSWFVLHVFVMIFLTLITIISL
jgi:hypothetical protein